MLVDRIERYDIIIQNLKTSIDYEKMELFGDLAKEEIESAFKFSQLNVNWLSKMSNNLK